MDTFLDPDWYRVAGLTPRLRSHVRLHRHQYRGQTWHVLQDNTTGRFHRFTPGAYELIGRMDGRRTMQSIWELACERLGDDAPSQPESLRLLHQLHAADVLQSDVPSDADELVRRYQRQRRQRWLQQIRTPVMQRLPLLDPERFLDRLVPWVRPLFGWLGAVLWLVVVGAGGVVAFLHWPALTEDAAERILTPQNLLLLWLLFPFVKALHELGHAFAVKVWGGEVHEVGVMFLVFSPVPYVDASGSSAFPDRHKRVVVGAAGMLVEVFLAAVALLVWVSVEPGLIRTAMYDVVIIAGVSTLLFNGNPLLRFDAYYILADAIEIPNLAARANRYLRHLLERRVFGVEGTESPVTAPGEARWFVFYAVASFLYRIFIYFVIVAFILSFSLYLGLLLAAWAALSILVLPVGKACTYLLSSPVLARQRGRALSTSLAFVATVLGAVFLVPVPLATVAEGVVWVPEQAIVRSRAGGFVTALATDPGDAVAAGDPLLLLDDPDLRTEVQLLAAELDALQARHRQLLRSDRVRAGIAHDAIAAASERLDEARERASRLTVHSPRAGTFLFPEAEDWLGRFVPQGTHLGFVVGARETVFRVAVPQSEVDLVRHRTDSIAVRTAVDSGVTLAARVLREIPAATRELPSAALGRGGGGALDTDPRDESGQRALDQFFQLELAPADPAHDAPIGSRVHVRFAHGREPLAGRWYRALRQLLLRQIGV